MIHSSPDKLKPYEKEKKETIEKQIPKQGNIPATFFDNEVDKKNAKLLNEAVNHNAPFMPDELFEKLVKNYQNVEEIYGKTFLNLISGFDPQYIKKNIKIPEFQQLLKKKIEEKVEELREDGLLDKNYHVAEEGFELAAFSLYLEELEQLAAKETFGLTPSDRKSHYGERGEERRLHHGDSYRNIAVRKSLHQAIKQGHNELQMEDLIAVDRKSTGGAEVIYAIDSSGSMKGDKIAQAKKAGVALAYFALGKKDKVGLISFAREIKEELMPTREFFHLLDTIVKIRSAGETNIAKAIKKSLELFSREKTTKHLILLTDAFPTAGERPEEESLEAAGLARDQGVTLSLVGLSLDKDGERMAKKLVEIGSGRLFLVKNLTELDRLILEDYNAMER